MIEPLLLCVVPVATYGADRPLTHASGFFFERDRRLFLVTSRHVMCDEDSGHPPDRLVIDLHSDLPWMLLGVHSSRLGVGSRDHSQDEALG